MRDFTQILGQIEDGDGQAAEKLLPLVCGDQRRAEPPAVPESIGHGV
jgi:hypothetical protein